MANTYRYLSMALLIQNKFSMINASRNSAPFVTVSPDYSCRHTNISIINKEFYISRPGFDTRHLFNYRCIGRPKSRDKWFRRRFFVSHYKWPANLSSRVFGIEDEKTRELSMSRLKMHQRDRVHFDDLGPYLGMFMRENICRYILQIYLL